jgi:Gpi18-like mannosyltransferase
VLFLWLLAGDQLINTAMVLGGGYLLWHLRTKLSLVTVIYGFCALGLILASGGTWSISRIAYGIVSLSIALGVLLERYPRWGYATMGFFTILLASFAVRFAQHLWIA